MNLKEQNEIVKQRLHYHFANPNGTYNIPKEMPFMKEFLSTVDKLCKMVDEQTEVNKLALGDVSNNEVAVCNHLKCSSRAIIKGIEHWQCMKCKQWFAN